MQRTCETIRLVAGSKQTDRTLGWQVWQMFQRKTKPSGIHDTIWRARTSMANCWLRSLWVEWFELSTRCWLPVGICRNREIEQHFFSLDREQSEIHISRHGIPEIVVTDNGPQYSSQTFTAFADAHGFTHRTSSPIYPQSNGVSERAVKTIKGLLKKSEDQCETLLAYSATPLSNGYSTAEILMGRKLRTTVPVVPSSLGPQWSHFQDERKAQWWK